VTTSADGRLAHDIPDLGSGSACLLADMQVDGAGRRT